MKKSLIFLLCLIILCAANIWIPVSADAAVVIRVGIYDNEPKIFIDDAGNPSGFWPNIINYIADREGWQLEYVYGTWTQCLTRLENNQIDMMPDVAYSEERDKKFDFSTEPVYVSWSRVYRRGGIDIQTILDLQDTNVAVMEGSINVEGPDGIKVLTEAFEVDCTFIEVDSYTQVFELVDRGEADAGVVSKDFAYNNKANYNVFDTAIIFQPVHLYFAFPTDSALKLYLIENIDTIIRELKGDGDSIYYQKLEEWAIMKPLEKPVLPNWAMWLIIGTSAVVVLFGGGALIFRAQVRKRTKELAEEVVQHKQSVEALRESEDRLRLILETIPVGLAVSDKNGKILQVNKAAINLSGFSEKELIGKSYLDFIGKEDKNTVKKIHEKAVESEANRDKECILRRKDGSKFHARLSGAPVKDQAGNMIGTLAMIEDITEHQRAEEEHQRVLEYRELDRLRTQLLSTVSHELRTPLAGIKGYTTLLIEYYDKLKKTQKWETLEAIDSSTDRLTDLIEHLLDMSRLDAGLLRLNMEIVKPSEVFLTAASEAKLRAPKYRLKIKVDKRLPMVMADTRRLRQVVDNLLDNAIKYSSEGTEITFKAEVRGEEIQVSVSDQGKGISADSLHKIFERFYRIEERLEKDPGGLGLGLSLCKALIEAHGGKIWAESEEGKGSTFYFTIPIKKKGTGQAKFNI